MITKELAQKVIDIVKCGLVKGVGQPEPGKMCIEAAICYAMGLPHGDNPSCVLPVLREIKISLNDCKWSSDAARAKGLLKLGIAQLGSDCLDKQEFLTRLKLKTIKVIFPHELNKIPKENQLAYHKEFLKLCFTAEDSDFNESRFQEILKNYNSNNNNNYYYCDDTDLQLMAGVILQVLIDMKSPGCEFLYLCE